MIQRNDEHMPTPNQDNSADWNLVAGIASAVAAVGSFLYGIWASLMKRISQLETETAVHAEQIHVLIEDVKHLECKFEAHLDAGIQKVLEAIKQK